MHIQCPNGHVLAVPETHAGKKVQCPACQTVMVVPAPPPAEPPVAQLIEPGPPRRARRDDYDDRPRGRTAADERDDRYDDEDEYADPRDSKAATREGLLKVRLGIAFHLAKVYVAVIGAILLVALSFVFVGQIVNQNQGNARGFQGAAGQAAILQKAMPLIVMGIIYNLTVAGLGIAGSALCLSAPARTGAKGAIIASLILEVAALLLGLALEFMQLGQPAAGILGWVVILSRAAGFICFFVFLKQLALFKKKRWLADNTSSVMWFAVILVVTGVVGGIISAIIILLGAGAGAAAGGAGGAGAGAALGGILMAIIGLGLIIAGLIWLVRYVRLLHDFRNVLP